MSNLTVREVDELRYAAQNKILEVLEDFQKCAGLYVHGVSVQFSPSYNGVVIAGVRIDVRLEKPKW